MSRFARGLRRENLIQSAASPPPPDESRERRSWESVI